ncbi:MAG: hypothetical protein ABIV06_09340 [Thermoanaerobaculia bacterium]
MRRAVDRRFVAVEPGRLCFGNAAGAWSSEVPLALFSLQGSGKGKERLTLLRARPD